MQTNTRFDLDSLAPAGLTRTVRLYSVYVTTPSDGGRAYLGINLDTGAASWDGFGAQHLDDFAPSTEALHALVVAARALHARFARQDAIRRVLHEAASRRSAPMWSMPSS